MNEVPDLFHRLGDALAKLGSDQSVAEFHGGLVGFLCAKGDVTAEEWLSQVAPGEQGDLLADEARLTLAELHRESMRQLNDPVLEFQPILPDESESIGYRVEALGEWCQGFLMGLTEGGVKETERLPGDAAEIVNDMVNISTVGSYDLSENEEDEEAYTELLEYVRAGVLLVNEELHPTKAAPRGDTRLH
jgi:uncharacterized protein YgfB (UPF0149 family)